MLYLTTKANKYRIESYLMTGVTVSLKSIPTRWKNPLDPSLAFPVMALPRSSQMILNTHVDFIAFPPGVKSVITRVLFAINE